MRIIIFFLLSSYLFCQSDQIIYTNGYSGWGNKAQVWDFASFNNVATNIDSGKIVEVENNITFASDESIDFTVAITLQGIDSSIVIDNDSAGNGYYLIRFADVEGLITIKDIGTDGNYSNGNSGTDVASRDGIRIGGSTALVDNYDGFDWCYSSLNVYDSSVVELKNSTIYDCDKDGLGYGVNVSASTLTAHDNYFHNNRHHIAGGGDPNCNYLLYNNIFDTTSTIAQGVDMHGWVSNTYYSGGSIVIHDNIFKDSVAYGITIRGVPKDSCVIYDNDFAHTWQYYLHDTPYTYPAIYHTTTAAVSDSSYKNVIIKQNTYGGATPPFWYYSAWAQTFQVQYSGEWQRFACIADSANSIDSLIYGDFNGDGITDIISSWNALDDDRKAGVTPPVDSTGHLFVSYSGITWWRILNDSSYQIQDLDVADVDGDGKSDLIYNESTYSSAGTGSWTALPQAFNTYTLYTKRDFNGDGVDDNYRISSD